jgi:tRNA1(Val) A37 N6-methylase TrmN6
LTRDALMGGQVALLQPARGYRAATDPVFLAAACPARPGDRVLDLGCGVGAVALCLAARVPGLSLHGLELQSELAALARRNAAEAGAALTVHDGDVARPPAALRGLSFDHVIANPPFFDAAVTPAPDPARDLARRAGPEGLELWVDAGLRRLRQGGWLTLIHRAEQLPLTLGALAGRAGAVAVLPLAARAGRPAGRVIVRARKDSRGPFTLAAPLVVHDGPAHVRDGDDYSAAAAAALRDGAALDF